MINFKYSDLKDQFLQADERLQHIVYALDGFIGFNYGKDITITSVFRDQEGSTHKYWRAIDIRVKQSGQNSVYEYSELKNIEEFLDTYIYSSEKPRIKTYVIHGKGDELHLHLQVNSGNITQLAK